METNKKLKAKDLINVGIYTAIYIVFFFVVGMLNAIPVLYPFLYVLIPLISGIPFMLFLTKTEKFGMVTIMSVICGVFWFFMGYTWTAIVGYVVFGLIADLVLKAGKYKNFKVDPEKSVTGKPMNCWSLETRVSGLWSGVCIRAGYYSLPAYAGVTIRGIEDK